MGRRRAAPETDAGASGSVDEILQRLRDPKTAQQVAQIMEKAKSSGALLLSFLAAVMGAMAGRRNPVKEVRAS